MTKQATIASLGELIMRLKSPGKLRLRQSARFDVCHGGAEANVANSLAQFGLGSRFISALPPTELGEQALMSLRASGVDVTHISRLPGRMGIYFLEDGADVRSGCVIYDRQDTAFCALTENDVDWDSAFDGVSWFHVSGITPAISASARDLCEAALKQAKARGIHISLDLNHRERLWQYGRAATDVMPGLATYADTLIAGRGDCAACLGFSPDGDGSTNDWYEELSEDVMRRYPNLSRVAVTIRNSSSADCHKWAAHLRTKSESCFSKTYHLQNVVDRVGTGDAFAAGLIYGLASGAASLEALQFGAAANALKHTITGDANMVTVSEVRALMESDGTGRLRR
ncbi:MAG: sugar kinase [Pseudomonadota bacterium]